METLLWGIGAGIGLSIGSALFQFTQQLFMMCLAARLTGKIARAILLERKGR